MEVDNAEEIGQGGWLKAALDSDDGCLLYSSSIEPVKGKVHLTRHTVVNPIVADNCEVVVVYIDQPTGVQYTVLLDLEELGGPARLDVAVVVASDIRITGPHGSNCSPSKIPVQGLHQDSELAWLRGIVVLVQHIDDHGVLGRFGARVGNLNLELQLRRLLSVHADLRANGAGGTVHLEEVLVLATHQGEGEGPSVGRQVL